MPDSKNDAVDAAPGFVLRNLEELLAVAHQSEFSLVGEDGIEPVEMEELDNIRLMREMVLDATVVHSVYRSGT
jgi:hypothetical protein